MVPVETVVARLPSRRGGCVQRGSASAHSASIRVLNFARTPDREASRDSSHGETRVVPSGACLAFGASLEVGIDQKF